MSKNKQNIEDIKIYEENYSKSPNNDYHIRKSRCKSRSKSWSKSRSRSKRKSKNKSKIKKYSAAYNYLSKETKRKNSKELMSISDFTISSNPKDEKYIETLFNKKNISKKLLNENKDLDLEQINIDNTLK